MAGVNIAHSGAERLAMLNSVRVRGTTSVTAGNDPLVIIDGVSSDPFRLFQPSTPQILPRSLY